MPNSKVYYRTKINQKGDYFVMIFIFNLIIEQYLFMDNQKDTDNQKEKQNYLFAQIIQKDYDPEEFQEFLVNSKPGGDDLANWSLPQLAKVVTQFQKKCDKLPENKESPEVEAQKRKSLLNQQKKELIDEYLESQQGDKISAKSKQEEGQPHIDLQSANDSFDSVVPCIQTTPSILYNIKNVQVIITKFEKREGGIFQQAYVSYHINTQSLAKTVERRYSDFEWLRLTLEWLHPGVPIPPLAKKGQFRRYDDKHLRKRLMILQMFLNKLLEIPQLRAEVVLQNFLKLDDKAAFQKFKANYKPDGKLIPLKTIKNLKGNLNLTLNPKTNNFNTAAERHFGQVQPVIKNLYKEFKGAATALQTCGGILKNLGAQCEALDRVQRKFRKQNELSYCPNNFFTITSEAVTRLAEQLQNQATIFRTEIYSMIKYESLYMLNIMDSFTGLQSFQEKYLQQKNALAKKKEKLFGQGQMDKWELEKKIDKSNRKEAMAAMLPKQTKKLAKIRDIYGLFNNEMHQQIARYFTSKNNQLGVKLQKTCKNQTRLCSEMMMIWVDAETNIITMLENKIIKRV